MGVARYRNGDYPDAIKSCQKSIELDDSSRLLDAIVLALSYWHVGKPSQAKPWYEKASSWASTANASSEVFLQLQEEAQKWLDGNADPSSTK